MQRADRNFAGDQHDLHHVKAIVDIAPVEQSQIARGDIAQCLLFSRVDRLGRLAEIGAGPRFYLDEGEHSAIPADQIDLAFARLVVAVENAVTVTP